jgi:hypothetical protein
MPSNTPSPRCSDNAPDKSRPLTELFEEAFEEVSLAEQSLPPQPEKIEASWDKWRRYVDLFTAQGQQEQFGIEEWHRDYKLVRNLEHILLNGEQQVTSFWNACLKYRWNRFERIF